MSIIECKFILHSNSIEIAKNSNETKEKNKGKGERKNLLANCSTRLDPKSIDMPAYIKEIKSF